MSGCIGTKIYGIFLLEMQVFLWAECTASILAVCISILHPEYHNSIEYMYYWRSTRASIHWLSKIFHFSDYFGFFHKSYQISTIKVLTEAALCIDRTLTACCQHTISILRILSEPWQDTEIILTVHWQCADSTLTTYCLPAVCWQYAIPAWLWSLISMWTAPDQLYTCTMMVQVGHVYGPILMGLWCCNSAPARLWQ